jgi:hypothetical protein
MSMASAGIYRVLARHQDDGRAAHFDYQGLALRPIERGQTRNPQREFCAITMSLPFSSI